MENPSSYSPADPAEIDAALARILASTGFSQRPRMRELLEYLVKEDLLGHSSRLKGYTIGTEVFGRPDNFDPSVDAIVRVEINRLRDALARYYSTSGDDDPIRITIPLGHYRPEYVISGGLVDLPELENKQSGDRFEYAFWRFGLLSIISVIGLIGLLVWGMSPGSWQEAAPAIVEVEPFEISINNYKYEYLASAIPAELVRELSHFPTLRIRSIKATPTRPDHLLAPDIVVNGDISINGSMVSLNIEVADNRDMAILWVSEKTLNSDAPHFQDSLQEELRRIVVAIAGSGGLIATDALRRLEVRDQYRIIHGENNFECLMLSYAFNSSKLAKDETRARQCLTALTASDTHDGQIWAAYSFLLFFDWSRTTTNPNDLLIMQARVAAQNAIRLDPSASEGFESLGNVLSVLGHPNAALATFESALQLNPSKPEVRISYGWARMRAGNWQEGLQDIQDGIELAPSVPGWFNIPLAIDRFRNGDFEESLYLAETIVSSGDVRGHILAVAAAVMLKDTVLVKSHLGFLQNKGLTPDQALDDIKAVFNIPKIMVQYDAALAGLSN